MGYFLNRFARLSCCSQKERKALVASSSLSFSSFGGAGGALDEAGASRESGEKGAFPPSLGVSVSAAWIAVLIKFRRPKGCIGEKNSKK